MADKKFLYISNHDPSRLYEHIEDRLGIKGDKANCSQEVYEALKSKEYVGVLMTDLVIAGNKKITVIKEDYLKWGSNNGIAAINHIIEKGLPLLVLTTFPEKLKGVIAEDKVFQKPSNIADFYNAAKREFKC